MCIYWLSDMDFQFCQPKFGALPVFHYFPISIIHDTLRLPSHYRHPFQAAGSFLRKWRNKAISKAGKKEMNSFVHFDLLTIILIKTMIFSVPLELPWSPGRSIQSNKVNRKYDVADFPMLHRYLQCQLVSLLQVQHLTYINVLIPYTFGKIIRYLTMLRLFILSWNWTLWAIVGGGCDMSMTVSASLELFL